MSAAPPSLPFLQWPQHQARCARCLALGQTHACTDGLAIFALESEVLRVRADLDPPTAPTTAAVST